MQACHIRSRCCTKDGKTDEMDCRNLKCRKAIPPSAAHLAVAADSCTRSLSLPSGLLPRYAEEGPLPLDIGSWRREVAAASSAAFAGVTSALACVQLLGACVLAAPGVCVQLLGACTWVHYVCVCVQMLGALGVCAITGCMLLGAITTPSCMCAATGCVCVLAT